VKVFQPSAGVVALAEALADGDEGPLALADTVGDSPAGDVVGGADGGEPQEASVSATHTPEKTVTADDVDDADRRIKAPPQRLEKTVD
jgi:hypothetical protein